MLDSSTSALPKAARSCQLSDAKRSSCTYIIFGLYVLYLGSYTFFHIFIHFLVRIGSDRITTCIFFLKKLSLRNRACRNASLVNANFSVNQMCPIICRWKLVKHRYCFGDNRRTKDNRKIKLCGLKACCVTLISCSNSPNFPALKRWNEKSEA